MKRPLPEARAPDGEPVRPVGTADRAWARMTLHIQAAGNDPTPAHSKGDTAYSGLLGGLLNRWVLHNCNSPAVFDRGVAQAQRLPLTSGQPGAIWDRFGDRCASQVREANHGVPGQTPVRGRSTPPKHERAWRTGPACV